MYILFIVHISLLFFFYFSKILALMRYSLIRVEIKFTTTTTTQRVTDFSSYKMSGGSYS